jgi:hypothetical protein
VTLGGDAADVFLLCVEGRRYVALGLCIRAVLCVLFCFGPRVLGGWLPGNVRRDGQGHREHHLTQVRGISGTAAVCVVCGVSSFVEM